MQKLFDTINIQQRSLYSVLQLQGFFLQFIMSVLHELTGILAHSSAQINILRMFCIHSHLKFFPKIFYGFEVWRLTRPFQNINTIILKPFLSTFSCVLRIVVLLKCRFAVKLQCYHTPQKVSRQNVLIFKAFIFPSMISISPTLLDAKHPHSITLPPPNFTVGIVLFGWQAVPFFLQTWVLVFLPKSPIFVSSDQIIFPQNTSELFSYFSTKFRRAFTCLEFNKGVFLGDLECQPTRFNVLLIVSLLTLIPEFFRSS